MGPGEEIELTVRLEQDSAAAYQAVYADGRSGADPPYGRGYGGNDSKVFDGIDTWVSSWTVASHAPIGQARVDIYVAAANGNKGFRSLPFTVAPAGAC